MSNNDSPDWWHFSQNAWMNLCDYFSLEDTAYRSAIEEKSNWLAIGGGVTNDSFCLDLGDKKLFVQLVDKDKLARLPESVFTPVGRALSHKEVLRKWLPNCYFDSENLRIFEWLNVTQTSAENFNSADFVHKLCEFLTALHGDISTLPMLDIKKHLNNYYQLALLNNKRSEATLKIDLEHALSLSKDFVASKTCHNDLSPGNILLGSQLYVVDWEYSCIGDPVFDLAGISINFNLENEQERQLFDTYIDVSGTYFHIDKFYRMKRLYSLVCKLWSA